MSKQGVAVDPDVSTDPVGRLAEDFVARYRRGERPALSEYTGKYPDLAERIRQVFPMMVMMEEAALEGEAAAATVLNPGAAQHGLETKLERLGGYRIVREIGRGGMGVVYEAEQVALGRHVALKVLPLQAAKDEARLERFRREACAAARLHHTNIVPVYEVGEEGNLFYYAMQFIPGQPLDQVLEELRILRRSATASAEDAVGAKSAAPSRSTDTGPRAVARSIWSPHACTDVVSNEASAAETPVEFALKVPASRPATAASSSTLQTGPLSYHRSVARIGIQIADALAYAHREGVIHRDIKPSNLLLDTEGRVWITDFGLAKTEADPLTQTGDIVGTLCYMSPERFRGWSDPRSDVYSVGLTLYEMLLLRAAFEERDRARLMHKVLHEEPPRLRKVDRQVPRDLATIITKAIGKEPSRRYQTAEELAADLQRFVEDRPILARQSGIAERTWRWCKRNPAVASLTVSVLILLLVIAGGALLSNLRLAAALKDVGKERDAKAAAELEGRHKLFSAYRGQIRGSRFSRQVGQRFQTLATIEKAVALAKELKLANEVFEELRTDAIAALAVPDLRPAPEWIREPEEPLHVMSGSNVDPRFQRYAVAIKGEGVRIHALASEPEGARELGRIPDTGFYRDVYVRWSPDRQFLVVAADGSIRVHKVEVDGKLRSNLLFAEPPATWHHNPHFGFSPDSRRFVFLHADGKLWVHDLVHNQVVQKLQVPAGSWCLAHHPRHPRVAVGGPGGIHIVDLADGRVVTQLPAETGYVEDLAWHPEGELLAVALFQDIIQFWNVPRRQRTWKMKHQGGGLAIAFNETGDMLASNTWAGHYRLWHTGSGTELFRLRIGSSAPDGQAQGGRHHPHFGHDNRLALNFPDAHSGALRRLTQVEVPREYSTLRAGAPIGGARSYGFVGIHPNGRLLAVGTYEGLSLIDLDTGFELAFLRIGVMGGLLFEPSGTGLLTKVHGQGLLRWPIQGGAEDAPLRIGPPERVPVPADGDAIVQSRDGTVLAISGGDAAPAFVWDRDQPGQARQLGPHFDCRSVSVSPDGRLVATTSHWGTGVKVWDAHTGKLLQDLEKDVKSAAAYFTADGRRLINIHGKCWHVPEPPVDILPEPWKESALPAMIAGTGPAVAPDRSLAAVGGRSGEVRLVHTQSGRVLARLEDPHQDVPYFLRFSPDGTRLVVTSHEGVCVHVWDLRAIRGQLARLGLDWDGPAYPPEPTAKPKPLRIDVKLGSFAFLGLGHEMRDSLAASGVSDWWRSIVQGLGAMTKKPTSAEAHFQRGKAHYDRRNKEADEQALADFTRALTSDREHFEAYHYRGHVYERLRHFDKAIGDFTEAIKRKPDDPHFSARRGLAHWRLHEYDKALPDLERGCRSRSDEAAVRHALAWLHVFGPAGMRDSAKAMAEAERIVDLAAKNPKGAETVAAYADTLGAAYYRGGNYAKAVEILSRADGLPKQTPTAINRLFLAMSHHRLGEPEKARACYEQALASLKAQTKLPQPQIDLLNSLRAEAEAILNGKQLRK